MRIEPAGGPQTFTWKGKEVECIPTSLNGGSIIDAEGNALTVDLKLIVSFDKFLTVDSTLIDVDSELWTADSDMPHPVAGRTLTFRGVEYRIEQARLSAIQSHYELSLIEAASNQ